MLPVPHPSEWHAKPEEVDPLRRTPPARKRALARQLRREPTPAERHTWSLLRNRQLLGLKFRRQHVLHGFIADFFCAELKLILELDGERHNEVTQAGYDTARTAWLRAAGYRVLRIPNKNVTRAWLQELVAAFVPPLPNGEGDRG